MAAVSGRYRPILLTATFTGLRASELRGLRWSDVDLDKRQLHVRQRADKRNTIGPPKSAAGERTLPLSPIVANTLKEHWLASIGPGRPRVPDRDRQRGISRQHRQARPMIPAWIAAGVVNPDGSAKYTGLHSLRHFYASWLINRRADGGLELPAKTVQERLGHSTIGMTLDTYSHLFPHGDAHAEFAAAERALLG